MMHSGAILSNSEKCFAVGKENDNKGKMNFVTSCFSDADA